MNHRPFLMAAAGAGLLLGASLASAEDALSGNVALATDYRFRGISQSDESLAVQGGFDYEDSSGFYLGAWGSSVDFDTNDDGYDGSLELDLYGGYSGSLADSDWGYQLGFIYYAYPGDNGEEGDYFEVLGGVSWRELSLALHYSNDYYAESGKFYYLTGDYSLPIAGDLSLNLHLGYNSLDEADTFLSGGADSYWDFKVGLGVSLGGVDLELAAIGTDLDEDEVFDTEWGEPAAVLTISRGL